jgi:hypothetical protein
MGLCDDSFLLIELTGQFSSKSRYIEKCSELFRLEHFLY